MEDLINRNIETTNVKKRINKKIVVISIIVVILIITVALGTTYYILLNKDLDKESEIKARLEQELKLENKTIEYGSEINFEEEVYLNENKVTNYKFNEVGTVNFVEVIKEDYKTFLNQDKTVEVKKEVIYTIEDTQKPIIEGVADKSIVVGETINLTEGIKASDIIDGELEIKIEGEVDTNTVGEYTVTIKAVDKNNNETVKQFIVKVEDKPVVKTTTKSSTTTKNNTNTSSGKSSNQSTNSSSGTITWEDSEWKGADPNTKHYILGDEKNGYYYDGGSVQLTPEQAGQIVTGIIE